MRALAADFDASELELQGLAIINKDIQAMLGRLNFRTKEIDVPAALGGRPGETIEVFYRVFSVK